MSDRQIEIVPPTPAHVLELMQRLREGDATEIQNAGVSRDRAVWRSYRGATYAKAILVDGEVGAVWGLSGCLLAHEARLWLLTTPTMERIPIRFVREVRRETALMLQIVPRVVGYVDATYTRAIRLLEVTGFTLGPERPFGKYAMPFRRYEHSRGRIVTSGH